MCKRIGFGFEIVRSRTLSSVTERRFTPPHLRVFAGRSACDLPALRLTGAVPELPVEALVRAVLPEATQGNARGLGEAEVLIGLPGRGRPQTSVPGSTSDLYVLFAASLRAAVEDAYQRLARGISGYRTSACKLLGKFLGNSESPTAIRL